MKYLELDFNLQSYAKITGYDYNRWGRGSQPVNVHAIFSSLDVSIKETVDIKSFDNISTSVSSLVTGDKVFIMPGVTIPRYKIRETGKEIGFDIVRSFAKANKVVFSKKQVIDEITDKASTMTIPVKYLIELLDHRGIDTTNLKVADVNENIILDYIIYNHIKEDYNNTFNTDAINSNHLYIYVYKDPIHKQLIDDLLAGTKVVISDQDVLKQCNGSKPLTSESFKRLDGMFSTHQNQEIAMELLCNCDYDQSMVYILKLISKHNFGNMPGTNHVNYKSFRSYMITYWEIDPSRYSGDIMDIIRILAKTNKLKREYLTEFKDEILVHVKRFGDNHIFTVGSINMNEDYKKLIID